MTLDIFSSRCIIHDEMHMFERIMNGRRYRVAAQSLWDPVRKRPFARQTVLGPADPAPVADLSRTLRVGERRVGDVGALLWVAEQLDVVGVIDRICGEGAPKNGPTPGEMTLAVAAQRACAPGSKRDLAKFLGGCLPRVSCLAGAAFSGQAFHRIAANVTEEHLAEAQIAFGRAAVSRFELSASVLAFDTTNFDTYIATTTPCELAQRAHAKSKRRDLRVVGLAVLASETGHVPLLHRCYPGNDSDQAVLKSCLEALGKVHDALGEHENERRRTERTIVRDGGFWSEQLELDLDTEGYYSLISLPLGHTAAQGALEYAAQRGKMVTLKERLAGVRVARLRGRVGELDRTLVVAESPELLRGQRRGIAAALRKAKKVLHKLARRAKAGRIDAELLRKRVAEALAREHLSEFVMVTIAGTLQQPTLTWQVDAQKRRRLERVRLGKRVLCTDRHYWSTGRIVAAFRGQWNVEELFRRAKRGGLVPWGPSHQWTDSSLRLHTFATVLGLMLISLARLTLKGAESVKEMMRMLSGIRATLVRTSTGGAGRRATVQIPPELTREQWQAVRVFELNRWFPALISSCMKRGQ